MANIMSPRTSHFSLEAGGSISMTVADCETNLKKCVEAMQSDEDGIYAGILEELQSKFLTWTSYLGVFADSQVCLDRRLERHPQYRDLVLWVLDTLNMNLLHMITAIGLDNSDSDDSSDDELERRKVELSGIQSSINELNRLAIYIRQSSMSSLDARVKAFRSRKPGEIWRFQTVADIALRTLYPMASESLRQQLSSSMVDRYAKLLYWKVHDRKLRTDQRRGAEPDSSNILVPIEQMKAGMPTDSSVTKSKNHQKNSKGGARSSSLEFRAASGVSSYLSGTIPSNLGSRLILPPAESESPAKKLANASTVIGTGVEFPKPPHFGTGEDLKPCPLCRKLLKKIDCFDEKWWRHHVNEDLTPFICVSNTCSQFPQFSRRTNWVEHMGTEHGAFWQQHHARDTGRSDDVCPICCMALQDQEPTRHHVQSSATGHFAQRIDKMRHFTDTANPRQPRPRTVQFDIPSGGSNINAPAEPALGRNVSQPVRMSNPKERLMMEHIAGHLQRLALLVPRLSVETLTSGDGNTKNIGSDVDASGSFYGKRSTLDDSLEDLTSNTFGEEETESLYEDPAAESGSGRENQHSKDPAQLFLAFDYGKALENPEESEETKSLRKDLEDPSSNLKPHGFFVPISHLQDLLTEPRLHGILQQHRNIDKNVLGGMKTFILRHAVKVFATLVWIGKTECIEKFYRTGFTDAMLPICKASDGAFMTLGRADQQGDRRIQDIFFSKPWSSTSREEWCMAQWIFLAPVFDELQFRYSIHDQYPLPVIRHGGEANDLFNHVQAGEIHWSHYRHAELGTSPRNVPVVIKQSRKPNGFDQADFNAAIEIEAGALESINNLNHRHLVKPLAYITRKGTHYFIFSGAENGNLRSLYKRVRRPQQQKYTKWFYDQTLGLAQAIEALHASPTTQLHKTLTPDHIVCLKNSSSNSNTLLAISGVGLAGFRDIVAKSRTTRSQSLNGRGSVILYDPPEQEKSSSPSLQWDIWSIGCIYLEMIIWFLYGSSELERFRDGLVVDRQVAMFYEHSESANSEGLTFSKAGVHDKDEESSHTYEYTNDVFHVHPRVRHWVRKIRNDPRFEKDAVSRRFIDLIRDRLLVPEVSSRANSRELRTKLESIHNEVMAAHQTNQ